MSPRDPLSILTIDRIYANAARRELDPFPHFYLENIFPEDYYQELLRNLPATAMSTTTFTKSPI